MLDITRPRPRRRRRVSPTSSARRMSDWLERETSLAIRGRTQGALTPTEYKASTWRARGQVTLRSKIGTRGRTSTGSSHPTWRWLQAWTNLTQQLPQNTPRGSPATPRKKIWTRSAPFSMIKIRVVTMGSLPIILLEFQMPQGTLMWIMGEAVILSRRTTQFKRPNNRINYCLSSKRIWTITYSDREELQYKITPIILHKANKYDKNKN